MNESVKNLLVTLFLLTPIIAMYVDYSSIKNEERILPTNTKITIELMDDSTIFPTDNGNSIVFSSQNSITNTINNCHVFGKPNIDMEKRQIRLLTDYFFCKNENNKTIIASPMLKQVGSNQNYYIYLNAEVKEFKLGKALFLPKSTKVEVVTLTDTKFQIQ